MSRRRIIQQGQKYGRITAIEPDCLTGRWACVCECGTPLWRTAASLLRTPNPCCKNCKDRVNPIVGQRYGKYECIEFMGLNAHRNALWRWMCDCGRGDLVMTHQEMRKRRTLECQHCINDRKTKGA